MNPSTDHICRSCGYSLAALESNRCPECGLVFDPDDPRTYTTRGASRTKWVVLGTVLMLFLIGIGATVFTYLSRRAPAPPVPVAPLYNAANSGDASKVQTLIDDGAAVDAREAGDIGTALIAAARRNDVAVAGKLLKAGADPDISTSQGTALLEATHHANDRGLPLVKALIAAGADPNAPHRQWGYTALHRAAVFDSPETVRYLLQNGADPHLTDSSGRTALDRAREKGHDGVAEVLREAMGEKRE